MVKNHCLQMIFLPDVLPKKKRLHLQDKDYLYLGQFLKLIIFFIISNLKCGGMIKFSSFAILEIEVILFY